MSAGLVVDGLFAGYDGLPVVRDVSFEVEPGSVVALLGPNGAGKTTILRTVSGLIPALAGDVEAMGVKVSAQAPHRLARRGLSHVSADRGLFTQLTVAENLRLATPRGRSARLDESIDQFPRLRELWDRRAGLLSGGEQQLLALVRALVRDPALLLIDEMSLGLAPQIARSLIPAVTECAKRGSAVLLVEQHVHLALEVAERILVLVHGEIRLDESAGDARSDVSRLESAYLGER